MAQRVEITLEDDLDGGLADETVQFALDGKDYEIDLSKKNADALRDALSRYVDGARKATRGRRSVARAAGGNRQEANQIRQWAVANGYEISSRGRVPANVRTAYEAVHSA